MSFEAKCGHEIKDWCPVCERIEAEKHKQNWEKLKTIFKSAGCSTLLGKMEKIEQGKI